MYIYSMGQMVLSEPWGWISSDLLAQGHMVVSCDAQTCRWWAELLIFSLGKERGFGNLCPLRLKGPKCQAMEEGKKKADSNEIPNHSEGKTALSVPTLSCHPQHLPQSSADCLSLPWASSRNPSLVTCWSPLWLLVPHLVFSVTFLCAYLIFPQMLKFFEDWE
jgi:hypothetical protein